jgi:hypothetical protein
MTLFIVSIYLPFLTKGQCGPFKKLCVGRRRTLLQILFIEARALSKVFMCCTREAGEYQLSAPGDTVAHTCWISRLPNFNIVLAFDLPIRDQSIGLFVAHLSFVRDSRDHGIFHLFGHVAGRTA